MIWALVVDDEPPARELLKHFLGQTGKVEIAAECENGDEALRLLEEREFDAVFLDIRMNSTDGLTVAREINRRFSDIQVVFTTGFSEYAVEAFEVSAVDYVMKPYSKTRVQQAVDRLIRDKERVHAGTVAFERATPPAKVQERITVWENGRMVVVAYANIVYCQARHKDQATIVTAGGSYTTNVTLKELEGRLAPFAFLRVHKSFIVCLEKIREILPWFNNTYMLALEADTEKIPVSRHYIKTFNQAMGIRG